MPRQIPRIHLRATGYKYPRAVCRSVTRNMQLTGEVSQITCGSCLRYLERREVLACLHCGALPGGAHDDQCSLILGEVRQ